MSQLGSGVLWENPQAKGQSATRSSQFPGAALATKLVKGARNQATATVWFWCTTGMSREAAQPKRRLSIEVRQELMDVLDERKQAFGVKTRGEVIEALLGWLVEEKSNPL